MRPTTRRIVVEGPVRLVRVVCRIFVPNTYLFSLSFVGNKRDKRFDPLQGRREKERKKEEGEVKKERKKDASRTSDESAQCWPRVDGPKRLLLLSRRRPFHDPFSGIGGDGVGEV